MGKEVHYRKMLIIDERVSKLTMLSCPETRKLTSEFFNKNWLNMNEIKLGL